MTTETERGGTAQQKEKPTMTMIKDTISWLAIRKEAGVKIDPETAEVLWEFGQVLDPYYIHHDLPDELFCIGRNYFARSPGGDVWVWFGDLPEATRDALWEKHKSRLAFPAELKLDEA